MHMHRLEVDFGCFFYSLPPFIEPGAQFSSAEQLGLHPPLSLPFSTETMAVCCYTWLLHGAGDQNSGLHAGPQALYLLSHVPHPRLITFQTSYLHSALF